MMTPVDSTDVNASENSFLQFDVGNPRNFGEKFEF
jgi:hypothetical protein